MFKRIISKKGIAIALIVICCLMVFTILIVLPNKISYRVEEVNGTYHVSVNNKWGKRIYENVYELEPIIIQVDKDTILIRTGRGDSWMTKFINGKTNRDIRLKELQKGALIITPSKVIVTTPGSDNKKEI